MRVGIIGYGNVGRGLHQLLEASGHQVLIGARDSSDGPDLPARRAMVDAVSESDVVILAIPFTAVGDLASEIERAARGKIVVDATNPLGPDWSPLELKGGLSAGEEIQRRWTGSRVVKAFNTVFADNFTRPRLRVGDQAVTTFVAGDDADARATVIELADEMGFAGVDVGSIRQARYLEALAHLNIQLAVGMQRGTNSGFVYFHRD